MIRSKILANYYLFYLLGVKLSVVSNCPPPLVGVKLSYYAWWCQIVLFAFLVSNCPTCHYGVKLSEVSNCPRILSQCHFDKSDSITLLFWSNFLVHEVTYIQEISEMLDGRSWLRCIEQTQGSLSTRDCPMFWRQMPLYFIVLLFFAKFDIKFTFK